jgi:hypothetical protein
MSSTITVETAAQRLTTLSDHHTAKAMKTANGASHSAIVEMLTASKGPCDRLVNQS